MKALRFLRLWPIIAFLILAASQMAEAAPAITVSPASGPPTTTITADGSGFGAYEAMDVYFDTSHLVLTVTSETGTFSCTLTAPRSAIPGVHWVTAVGRKSKLAAQKPFTVRTNWSQFHYGPQHRGYNPYENVLSPSTVAGLNEAWRHTMGPIQSSPAVANGIVYVGSVDGKLYALDASTGAYLWSYFMADWISSSPAVANGVVYLGGILRRTLYALNASTGALKWSYETGGGIGSSPAAVNGVVYVGSEDGNLYALDAQTGTLLWNYTTGNAISSSPVVANGMVSVGSEDGSLYAFSTDPKLVYRTIIRRPDPAELIPDLSLQPQVGKRTIKSSEEGE